MSAHFSIVLHEDNEEWMPAKSHDDDAGFDLKARAYCEVDDLGVSEAVELAGMTKMLHSNRRILIMTGICLGLTPGWEAQIRPRSGLALKHGITIVNSPGTIDAGYRNEIGVILHNTGQLALAITRGDRIAQMVIKQVPHVVLNVVPRLDQTDRGRNGYGSSGK